MNLERITKLRIVALQQEQKLRSIGMELGQPSEDSENIIKLLNKAADAESDRFEKIKIRQRILDTDSNGAGLSDYSEEIYKNNDIKTTLLEMAEIFPEEISQAKSRHTELKQIFNKKIADTVNEIEQLIRNTAKELKEVTDEINLISGREKNLVYGKDNALEKMNRHLDERITYFVAGQFTTAENVRQSILKSIKR